MQFFENSLLFFLQNPYYFASLGLPPCTAVLFFVFTPLGLSHRLSTMKRFAFCAIRPSIQGQHPWGHINSTVRTMPPSCQLPSASIPSRERERRKKRDSARARGWDSLEKKRKGEERREKNRKTNERGRMFSFLRGWKGTESLWIWVSHY